MRSFLKWFAGVLLLFNGAGALLGGWLLMRYPDGSGLHLVTDLLRHSPFSDFFIPGIILFLVNGCGSIAVLAALLLRWKGFPGLVVAQGLVLLGWLAVQVLMLQLLDDWHWIMGGVGAAMVLVGRLLVPGAITGAMPVA